jgi:hypothetical protein
MLHDIWRELVFLGGRIRRTKTIPWFTWKEHRPYVFYEEIMDALKLLKIGDIGLHLEWGAFSNLAIPGFMKHAWIQTNASHSLDRQRIVEATQEGVWEKHPLVPMRSDYVIMVRPRYVEEQDCVRAIHKARKIVGCKYDVDFKFDIEDELDELKQHSDNMKRFDKAFSCTETVSFSWWHCHEQLRLFRSKRRGKEVILADDFLRRTFEIVWMSDSVTTDIADKYGLHDEGLGMIEEYKAKQVLKGRIDNSCT